MRKIYDYLLSIGMDPDDVAAMGKKEARELYYSLTNEYNFTDFGRTGVY